MKLTNREVEAIAGAMADKAEKQRDADIKAAKNAPAFRKEVKKWTAHIRKMPAALQDQLKNGRHGFSETSVADLLFDIDTVGRRPYSRDFEQQVRLTAMESKNLTELKAKLGITF